MLLIRISLLLLQVRVEAERVVLDGPGPVVELRPWEDRSERVVEGPAVPRFDGPYDRLYSRWQRGDGPALWATEIVSSRPELPPLRPLTRKGLAGVDWQPERMDDVLKLGATSITVNVFLNGPLERTEQVIEWASTQGISVAAILLAPKKHPVLSHPDAVEPGIYALPNVRSEAGVKALGDIVRRLGAGRGRVAHWIVGNEVDSAWMWTNAGVKTPAAYMEEYLRVMRVVHAAARSVDPHARTFISLTHCWNRSHHPKDPRFYKGRELLEILEARSRAEGDFEWGVAFHPYAEDLFNPRTWEDRTAVEGFDTPRITFKNLQVLDAWMKREAALWRGKPRGVILSEQGFHTREGPDGEALQAAALAYAWNRVQKLDVIEAFQYHRWVDHEKEGGLRLGLWTVKPGSISRPERPKLAHAVFAALGTPREEEATSFALPLVGAKSWDEIRR